MFLDAAYAFLCEGLSIYPLVTQFCQQTKPESQSLGLDSVALDVIWVANIIWLKKKMRDGCKE